MRRALLPAVLACIAVGAGGVAAWPDRGVGEHAPGTDGLRTPVLSVRRVPDVLADLAADRHLTDQLGAAVADPTLGAARDQTCLVVRARDRTLFGLRPRVPLIPASNLKLLTGVAALEALGADAHLQTRVRATVAPGGVVDGDLWLVGGGDPLLATADYAGTLARPPQPFTPMEELARRVAAAGVREVRGRVVGDETRYDAARYLPSWRPSYRTLNEIGPQSALTVNDNFSQWRPLRVAAAQPATNAAAVFTNLLRAQGVAVVGVPGEGVAPADAPVVAGIESPPLVDVVGEMLRESDNLTAELVLKELGRRNGGTGTTAGGVAEARRVLLAMGLPVDRLVAVDGSGLDRGDRATCDLLVDALSRPRVRTEVGGRLAVANRSGTLLTRFARSPAAGRLRAKTGSLDRVAALSGYADGDGVTLAFSLVANGLPADSAARTMWERVGAALVAYPQRPDPRPLAPR